MWLAMTDAHMTAIIWIAIGRVFSAEPDSLNPTSDAMIVWPDIMALVSAWQENRSHTFLFIVSTRP